MSVNRLLSDSDREYELAATTNIAGAPRRSLRSFLALSCNDNMSRDKNSLARYLHQAAFFSCALKALTATIMARVVSCGDAFVGRYLGTSARSFTYPRPSA